MSDVLQELQHDISEKLLEIEDMFKRPVKITIVIRTPWLADGGVLISNDDFDTALAEIQRLRAKQIITGRGQPMSNSRGGGSR